MRRFTIFLCFIMIILGTFGFAGAAVYSLQPSPADLWDLDHYKKYYWGFELDIPDGETIVGASLFFDNIRNWDSNPNDLWVRLLDWDRLGVRSWNDYQVGGDSFAPWGILLNHWEDLSATAQDITYDFERLEIDTLEAYLVDDIAGLAVDPDCHFYNDGITLTVETASVPIPEPTTILLVGSGFLGIIGLRRKYKRYSN